jgi:hypothetical protein
MSKGKQSTFLKGQKQKNSGRSEGRVSARTVEGRRSDMPNSTKVGQGTGYTKRGFNVQEKRSHQEKGGPVQNTRSKRYERMKAENEAKLKMYHE